MVLKKRRHPSEVITGELDRIERVTGMLRAALAKEPDFAYMIPRYRLRDAGRLMGEMLEEVKEEMRRDPEAMRAARGDFKSLLAEIKAEREGR